MKKKSLKKYLILKIYEKKIEQFVIKNANKILIVYKIIESYVLKQGGKNPEVLHNSIDLEKFRNAHALTDLPKPLVISVGNLSQEKNHQCIIRAMQKINASCIIIGRGEKKKELSKLIESLNLNDKIIMKDSVPYSEIASYYKSADIFALAFDPELEGIPKPVIEAMACGLPVICTTNTGGEDLIKQNESGFVIPIRDIKSLKETFIFCHGHLHPGECYCCEHTLVIYSHCSQHIILTLLLHYKSFLNANIVYVVLFIIIHISLLCGLITSIRAHWATR